MKQKYKLPKSAARSIVAEAKSSLKMKHDVMYSKPLELKCVEIAEKRGFLENGKPVEKKPQRTTWIPSQPTVKPTSTDVKSRVIQILSHPEQSSRASSTESPSRNHRPIVSRTPERNSNSRIRHSSQDRGMNKPAKSSSSERPRRSRFVPSARVSKVLDPIVEASYSTDDDSVVSCTEKPTRRRLRRNVSSETSVTASSSASSESNLSVLMPLREHILNVVGDCTELDVVSDHAKGFRATDFDSRSYTSLTVGTDAESVSSNGSGFQWSASPRKICESPRKSVSMGSAEVKSFAMRFDSDGGRCVVSAPPRPKRRNSNEDLEGEMPPIRVLNEPPIGVVVTPARMCPGF